ncbi:MAG: hypothetical protein RLZZ227_3120 [Pseudomonadota bacterium]|jgi:fructokinase
MTTLLCGAVEAGGTKFICEVADSAGAILDHVRIPTTTPQHTLAEVIAFFARHETPHARFGAFGLAAFGPLDTRAASPTYGHILQTPKPQWSGTDLVGPFARRFACPVRIDTDVNAAALAEARDGAGRGCALVVYLTVGTGIGGGICIAAGALPTSLHPEMGHIRVLRHRDDRDFAGVCPFHGDCVEGLASGPALAARLTGVQEWERADHVNEVIGYYLGQLVANVILMLSPQRIIIGGGVMTNAELLPEITRSAARLLNGYAGISAPALHDMIVRPGLGERSGIAGALALAQGCL